MCGIIAAATDRSVGKLLIKGLYKMEYRGYDSAGIALHVESDVAHLRTLGKVNLLEEKMKSESQKAKLALLTLVGRHMANLLKSMRILINLTTEFLSSIMESLKIISS